MDVDQAAVVRGAMLEWLQDLRAGRLPRGVVDAMPVVQCSDQFGSGTRHGARARVFVKAVAPYAVVRRLMVATISAV